MLSTDGCRAAPSSPRRLSLSHKAMWALRSFRSLSCGNVSVVQSTGICVKRRVVPSPHPAGGSPRPGRREPAGRRPGPAPRYPGLAAAIRALVNPPACRAGRHQQLPARPLLATSSHDDQTAEPDEGASARPVEHLALPGLLNLAPGPAPGVRREAAAGIPGKMAP
jgi:hypothetical protein